MKRLLISTIIGAAALTVVATPPAPTANAPLGRTHGSCVPTGTILTGTLPSGMTYYVMRNAEPKGQADFFLTQRTGSVQEKESERGLAHFLEHMAFNGSEHFPGNSLIEYLESVGVKFGADLNAYTSTDETVYNISRVPATRQSTLDSCLLIVRDWSCALSLRDSDINAERGVIEGEWRHRRAASNRILEKILPDIYPASIYGKRMPIGLMSVVRNFKPQTLRDFYHRWHNPRNQAVIVVGDFDPAVMEAKVRQMFATAPATKAQEAVAPKVPDNKKMIVAAGSDPEQRNDVLQLHFKHQAPDLKGEAYWRRQVGEELLASMLAERFDSLEQTADCPWTYLGVGIGRFMMSRAVNSLVLRGTVKEGREKEAFAAWYAEVLRALDHGFTAEEMDMAKTEYMGSLAQKRRAVPTSTGYARRFSRHFLDGGPLLTVAQELDSLQAVIDGMTPEYCTELLASVADRYGSGRNMVVVAMQPEKGAGPDNRNPASATTRFNAAKSLTSQLTKAMDEVNAMDLPPYSVRAVTGPLLASEPARGSIGATDTVPAMGARLLTLSNGVKVYAKRTDFKAGQFYVRGSGPGGLSQRYTTALAPQMKSLNDVMPLCRYGNYTQSQLRRRLAGKDIKMSVKVENTDEGFEFSAGPDDREDAFRLLHLRLTDVRPDHANFAIWQAATIERLKNVGSDPVQQMGDSIHRNVYNHHPLGAKETPGSIRALDLDTIVGLYRDRFADVSDFTLYVVGDFEWPQLEDLLERYVASLPAAGRVEKPRDIDYRYAPGRRDIDFTMPMQTPTAICYSFLNGPTEYNIRNYLCSKIAGQILNNRLLKELREEKGWTYSVTGHCGINPDLNGDDGPALLWPVYIKTAPEHAAETRQAVEDAFALLAKEGPTVEEIEKVRSYLLKNHREGLRENGFWLSAMGMHHDYGLDFAADYAPALESITPADIAAFTARAVAANRTRLTLTPQ